MTVDAKIMKRRTSIFDINIEVFNYDILRFNSYLFYRIGATVFKYKLYIQESVFVTGILPQRNNQR